MVGWLLPLSVIFYGVAMYALGWAHGAGRVKTKVRKLLDETGSA